MAFLFVSNWLPVSIPQIGQNNQIFNKKNNQNSTDRQLIRGSTNWTKKQRMPDTFGGLVLFRVLFASHPRFLTVSTSHLLIVEALLFLSGIENKKEKKKE
jgi:hypothetical protein